MAQVRHMRRIKLDHCAALAARKMIMFRVRRGLEDFAMIILIEVTGFDQTVRFEESQRPIDRRGVHGPIVLLRPCDDVLGRQVFVAARDHVQDDAAGGRHAPPFRGDGLFGLTDKLRLSHGDLIASELQ